MSLLPLRYVSPIGPPLRSLHQNFPKENDVRIAAFAHSSASSVVLPFDVVPEDEVGDAS